MPVADTWVVEVGGELIAFMSLLGNLIGGLFTQPDRQGEGHGRALIEHARERYDPVFVEAVAEARVTSHSVTTPVSSPSADITARMSLFSSTNSWAASRTV